MLRMFQKREILRREQTEAIAPVGASCEILIFIIVKVLGMLTEGEPVESFVAGELCTL